MWQELLCSLSFVYTFHIREESYMKKTLKVALLASSAIAIASSASANAGLAKLINNANNWAHPNGNYELHRHSSLKQINKSKAK